MLKKTITYTDYNGNTRTEDFYFNMTKTELTKMELSTEGGLEQKLTTMIAKLDGEAIITFFSDFITKAYGEKTADGKHFVKKPELSEAFTQTDAYDKLFMELVTDAGAAAIFINAVIPQSDNPPPSPK